MPDLNFLGEEVEAVKLAVAETKGELEAGAEVMVAAAD